MDTTGTETQEVVSEATENTGGGEYTPEVSEATEGTTMGAPDSGETTEGTSTGIDNLQDALKVITDLRKENARARTNAKETAANEARQDIAQTIAKALGLTPDGTEDASPDPLEQVKALTEEVSATKARAEQATLELAIYKTSAAVGANPTLLLDSRSFMSSVADINPNDGDAVASAIKSAVEQNPSLRAVQVAGSYRTDHTPGGSTRGEPKSLEEALAAHYGG